MALVECAGLLAALMAAAPGETVTLKPGSLCEKLELKGRDWAAKPVTLVLEGAEVRGVEIQKVSGLIIRGGTISAPGGMVGQGPSVYGLWIRDSRAIAVDGVLFTRAMRGVVVGRGEALKFSGNRFSGLRSEGINLASSRNIDVEANEFTDFSPIASSCVLPDGTTERGVSSKICKGKGGQWTDGDHADAVQLWGNPTDIRIRDNRIVGQMQAIGLFGPPGDRGSGIVVEGNYVRVGKFHGITLNDCTNCRIAGNDVAALPGVDRRVIVRFTGSTGTVCGNKAPAMKSDDPAVRPCPKG